MMKAFGIALLALLPLVASAKNEVILTAESGKAGQVAALDVATGGDMAAFDIRIQTGVKDAAAVDLTACTAGIGAGKMATCAFNKGVVSIAVISSDGKNFPAGVVNVGRIVVKGASALSTTQFGSYDQTGSDLESKISGSNQESK